MKPDEVDELQHNQVGFKSNPFVCNEDKMADTYGTNLASDLLHNKPMCRILPFHAQYQVKALVQSAPEICDLVFRRRRVPR